MAPRKKTLKHIRSGALTRGLSLAGVALGSGAQLAGITLKNVFSSDEKKSSDRQKLIISRMSILTEQLGQLKGSLMKVGQMLSILGDQFLPPEAMDVLRQLRSDTPPLEWEKISRVLHRQLGQEALSLLDINSEALACASLGQVHRARIKANGQELALKIRYPGVDKAIDSDLVSLKRIFRLASIVPKSPDYDEIFSEVRAMMHQEVDYDRERNNTDRFRELLKNDHRFIVPKTFPQFSTKGVLATSFESGDLVDGPIAKNLSQDRKNRLAEAGLDLFFRELFEFREMQTDPHFGNYLIRLDAQGISDQWVLLDFGAVRMFSKEFIEHYRRLVKGLVEGDRKAHEREAEWFGVLNKDDGDEFRDFSWQLSRMFAASFLPKGQPEVPIHLQAPGGEYCFGKSDLTKRILKFASLTQPRMTLIMKSRTPPRELVFLNRKMGGVFAMMATLNATIDARSIILKRLQGA